MAFIDFEPEDVGGGFVDFDAEPAPSTDRGILGSVADIGLTAAKGAIGVPETVVGIADLLTFGQAGKLAEEAGFRPKEAKAMLDQFYTPAQQAANEAVKIPGFLETLKAAIENPSTILHAAIESTPSMLGGGVIARGLLKAAPAMAPLAAGAIGEGVVTAGQNAEQLRQETPGGTLTAGQSALMAGSGALTGLLGFAGGRAAKKLGIADIDTWLAKGGSVGDLAKQPGLLKRVSGGMLSEGVFEELPQSAQEQIAQNIALQKPWNENVGNAAAMGMLVGTVMGGGANVLAPGADPAPPFVPQNIPAPIETAGRVMSAPTLDAAIAETANAALGPAPRFERMLDESAAGGLIDSAIRQQQFDRAQGPIEAQKAREERQILLDSRNQQADEAITAAETPPLREPFSATPAGTPPNTALADELKRARELYTLRRMEALGIKGTDEQSLLDSENVQSGAINETESNLARPLAPENGSLVPQTGTLAPNQAVPGIGTIVPKTGTIVPNQGIPADAEISPKTVGGIPVSAQSTEQLRAIVQNPETPPTTRHAAVAAIQARAQETPQDLESANIAAARKELEAGRAGPMYEDILLALRDRDNKRRPAIIRALWPEIANLPKQPTDTWNGDLWIEANKNGEVGLARIDFPSLSGRVRRFVPTTETPQNAPGQAQIAPPAEGIAAAQPAQGAQALQIPGTSEQVPSNRNIPGPAVAEKATIAAEKATPTYTGPNINGQVPSVMTVAQLQHAVKNAPFWDQKDAAAEELKRRDKIGETYGGRSADQWTDKEVDLLARRSSKPALKAAARAEGDRRAAADIELAARLKSAGTAEQLQQFAGEAGWAEKGGFLIRVKTGDRAGEEKVSRTSWVPRAEWWPGRPVQENEKFYQDAVAKAVAGESLTRKQKDVVRFLMGLAEDELVGAQVEPDTTPALAAAAQDLDDVAGNPPENWRELSEDEQNDKLDFIYGEDSQSAPAGQEARAPDDQGEMGQADEPGSAGQARRVYNPDQQGIDFGEPAAKANAAAERAQAGKPITADQRDIFNDQGGLFDGPAKDLSAADALRLVALKMDEAAGVSLPEKPSEPATKPQESAANRSEATTAPAKAGDFFTVDRLIDGEMRTVTFQRGEYAKALMSGSEDAGTSKWNEGEITGISQARREAKIGEGDLWYGFGSIYKAERPVEAAPKGERVTLSSAIEESNAKHGSGLTEADRVPGSIGGAESRQSSAAYMADQTQTEAFKRWSNNAPLITSAQADSHGFKTGERVVLEAFHGTQRPDRVGTTFKKSRATSGPMAFHTSDPQLASSYAQGKSDTSLANEDQDYPSWFKYKPKGERSAVDIVRAWYRLDRATQDKIAEIAPTLRRSEDGNAVISEAGNKSGNGSYDYNLSETQRGYDRRGNPLKALVEDWLSSGILFNDEEVFMDVLKKAGFPTQDVAYDSPDVAYPFVYKNYIAMQNPLVTSDIPQSVTDALNAAAKRDRARPQLGGDLWDKTNKTLRSWVEEYNKPDNAYVWSSIPDKVTEVFKSLGYDGIIDWSGKNSPESSRHPVYIPFHENQIKSAIGNKGTFSTDKNNILRQRKSEYNDRQLELIYENHDLRPGTTQKQKDQGIHAIRSLFGGDRRAGATLLGSSIWADFKARLGSELIGQKVRFAQDLAILAQILRDPRFETLRFFFVKDGKVIEHTGMTSRMPGSVSFIGRIKAPAGNVVPIDESAAYARLSNEAFDEKAAEIKAAMERAGADGYYVLHNHPGGLATPSSSDRDITQRFAKQIPGFKGHVVIDHNEYAVINRDGTNSMHSIKSPQNEAPEVAHDMLGQKIGGPLDLIAVAKNIQAKRGFSVLIGQGGSDGRVTAIAEVPSALLNGKTKMEQMKALVRLRRFGRFSGSSSVFVVSENPTSHDYLIENGAARDVVSTAGLSRRADGVEVKRESQYATGSVRAEQPNNKTDTPAFKRWFGDSKVVDAGGKPLVVYHGTNRKFNEFEPVWKQLDRIMKPYEKTDGGSMQRYYEIAKSEPEMHFFTEDEGIAEGYADQSGEPTVIQAYLRIENPAVDDTRDQGSRDRALDAMIANGNDGAIFWDTSVSGRYSHRAYAVRTSTQIKSATGNRGTYDPNSPSIVEQEAVPYNVAGSNTTGDAAGNRASWDAPEPGKLDTFIRVLQDKHIDTRRVVTAIKNATGALRDATDVYLQEELFHGRSAKAVAEFLDMELRPLFTEMAARKIEMPEFEEYLHARHAEERNKQIAKINPEMPDGGSGMDTADARAYLEALEPAKKRAHEALAERVDAINAKTRQDIIAYGLESPDTIQAWEDTYKNYVPLHREDMEGGPGIGQGYSVRGPASKRAMGSKRAVVDILANVAMQRERVVVRGEKNRVANALVGLAIENPNPDFWKVDKPPILKVVNDRTGLVEERVDPLFKSRENVIVARIPGPDGNVVEHAVIFNERDERAARMVTALKNLDTQDLGEVLGLSAKITRYFSSINTQYNPVFGVVNLIRDTQGALFNLSTTDIRGKQSDVLKHTISALRGIYIDARAARGGEQPTSAWSELWEEFQREGGQTGYRDMFRTSKDRAEAIEREIKKVSEGKAKQFGRSVFDWLSDYNNAMENAVRLAAYKVGKENGMTNQRAASMAKNLTVNFNRKGQIGVQTGALYAFFNASVQGTARMLETLNGPSGRKIIAGGFMLGSMQALLLAAAGFDDDEPPDFVRERSLILPIGNKKYLTIPMPLGLHILPNLGRIPTEFVLGGFKRPQKKIASLINVFVEAFNPIGNAGLSLQTIAPTVIDPIAALAENKDWTGKPIAREDFNKLAPTPGHTRAKDTASVFSKAVSQGLNWVSGGTNYKPGIFSPTPDQIDYLIGQVAGGLGREAMKAEQTVTSAFSGEELPTYKIPLLGRFYGSSEGQAQQGNTFYSNLKEINEHEAEIKGRRKAGEPIGDYTATNPEARLVGYANKVERQVSQLRRQKRELTEKGANKDRIKAIDARITQLMRAFNDRVRSVTEKKAA